MASSDNLLGEWKALRTLFVVPEEDGGQTCVSGNILAHADVFIDDHSEDEVRIVEDHIPPIPLS